MRGGRTAAAGLASLLTALVATFPQAATAAEPTSIYGLELETAPDRERLLVFASGSVRYRLVERDARTVELRIEDASLDASAPPHVAPGIGGSITGVRAREESGEVVVAIKRRPGLSPEVSSRGSMIAVDFPGLAQRPGPIALQYRDAEIADVVRGIADATGESFVFDQLAGRVTIVVGDPVSRDEALELLDSALLLLGHAALPTPGGPRKIVPIAAGAGEAPWRPHGIAPSDRMATTLLHLEAAPAEELATTLAPWLGKVALALPVPATNSLILAGAESHLQQILTAARALDTAASESLVMRRLRHRTSDELAEIVLDWANGAPGGRPVDVWSIPRTETLVVRAAPEDAVEIERLVDRLDRVSIGSGDFHVMRVRDRDAAEVADTLGALTRGDGVGGDEGLAGRDYGLAVDVPTNSLLVRSDPETAGLIADVVDELDRRPPQIRVEMKLMEVTTSSRLRLGFDAFLPSANPDSNSLSATLLNPSGASLTDLLATPAALRSAFVKRPLLIPIIGPNGMPSVTLLPRETAVVTAEEGDVESQIVMRPDLLVTSGEEHVLFAGNNIPIPVGTTTDANAAPTLTTTQNIERQDVGLRMRVLPTATETGGVRLELDLDLSSLLPSIAGDVNDVGPTLRQRRLESVIHLQGSEFAVIGLSKESVTDSLERGVPFFKDIPVLGWAFRRVDDVERISHLLIAVSARLEPSGEKAQSSTIRRQLAALEAIRPQRGPTP